MNIKSLIFAFYVLVVDSQCANILGVFPVKLKSHYIVFQSIMMELARRGHNVTVINPFPRHDKMVNFTDVDVTKCYELPDFFRLDAAYKYHSPLSQIPLMTSEIIRFREIMECDVVKNFLKRKDSYDLVITELFNEDVTLGFAYHFDVPFVLFCAGPIYPWGADRMGNPDNPSYIPYPHNNDKDFNRYHPTFYQRLYNVGCYLFAKVSYSYYSYTIGEDIAQKAFGPEVPKLNELAKNTSLILAYSHFSINTPQPMVPGIVEVAGVQIQDVKPLPKEIQKFIDESEHGVIYFCMGSLLKPETMPEDKLIAFQQAFTKVPQRIIWKWGDTPLPGKTDKIFTAKWMPQRDILAHPKIKLFISHGGALGLNEAVFEGVPVLGIPIFGDQTSNLRTLKAYGAAEILPYTDINNDTVLSRIQQVLKPEYATNMNKVSQIYKDRPMNPMDTAIYWIDYVIRHDGARHLRSAAVDLPLYQYLLLDVIVFILAVTFSVIFIVYYLLRKCLSICTITRPPLISPKKRN